MTNPAQAQVTRTVVKLNGHNLSVPAYCWSDHSRTPQAVIVAVHGGVQHAGVYNSLGETFAAKGYLVYSIDLRGHGQWLIDSKHRPKVNYIDSTEDVVALTHQLRAEHTGLPVFAIGESLGAGVSLHAVLRDPTLFDGMILASPGTSLHVGRNWHSVFPTIWTGVESLGRSVNVSPQLRCISDDPRSNEETLTDPRNRRVSSVGDLLHTAKFVHSNAALATRVNPEVPILVLQGTHDKICSVKSVKSLFAKFPTKDKSLKTIDGVGHLLVTTAFVKPVVADTVSSWLESHIKPVVGQASSH